MKHVFKYTLMATDTQVINIHGAVILSVQEQDEEIVVYALTDRELPLMEYEFRTIGTGHQIDFDTDLFTFLGTVKLHNGRLMFHVFYRKL